MLPFDITQNVSSSDSLQIQIVKLSYASGCLSVLISQCENNLCVLSASPAALTPAIRSQHLAQSSDLLVKYRQQKASIDVKLIALFG